MASDLTADETDTEPDFADADQLTAEDRRELEAAIAAALLIAFLLARRRLLYYLLRTETLTIADVPLDVWAELELRIKAGAAPVYQQTFRASVAAAAGLAATATALFRLRRAAGISLDAAALSPGVAAAASPWSELYSTWLAQQMTATTQRGAALLLDRFRAGRLTPDQLESRLNLLLGDQRAVDAAVTETTRGIYEGQNAMRQELERASEGRKLFYEVWRTEVEGPSNVCPICEPLDGLRDEEWRDAIAGGGSENRIFVDANGPPIHVKCACGIVLEPTVESSLLYPPSVN